MNDTSMNNMSMNNDAGRRIRPPRPGDGGEALSGRAILAIMTLIAVVCVGGYFFLMKMIDVSRQDDCVLAQRRNCSVMEPFPR